MSTRKDYIFRKVVQYADTELPAADFTAIVMKEVTADLQEEKMMNPALSLLLKEQEAERPLPDFTHHVMALVTHQERKVSYQPIISKRTGCMIAATISIVLLLLISNTHHQHLAAPKSYQFLNLISAIPLLYFLLLMAIGALLWIDYLIKYHSLTTKIKHPGS